MARSSRLLVVLGSAVAAVGLALYLWEPVDTRLADGDVPVWNLDADAISRLRLVRGDETIVLVREGDDWRLTEPVEAAADASEVRFVLDRLAELAGGRELPGEDLSQYGLEPPRAELEVQLSSGASYTLALGDEAPTGYRTYIQQPGGPPLVGQASLADVVEVELGALRERRVLGFAPEDVRRVRLSSPAGVLDVTGSGHDWFIAGWSRANVLKVEDLLYNLRGVRFLSFSPDTAPDGIAEPGARVEVSSHDATWAFSVGEQGPMGVFLRRDDGVAGFADPEQLGVLGAGPLDLVQRNPFRCDPETEDRVIIEQSGQTLRLERGDDGWTGAPDAAERVAALAAAESVYLREATPPLGELAATITVERDSGRTTRVGVYQQVGTYRLARDLDGGEAFRVDAATLAPLGL